MRHRFAIGGNQDAVCSSRRLLQSSLPNQSAGCTPRRVAADEQWIGDSCLGRPNSNRARFRIHPADGGLLWLAGLYESGPGRWQRTFTIMTIKANRLIELIHD